MTNKITQIYRQWSINKHLKKKKKIQDKKMKQFCNHLKELYNFVHWLNTEGLKSRKERKIFWRRVRDNSSLTEEVIQNLLKKYEQKSQN